jgi:hypothetical protein
MLGPLPIDATIQRLGDLANLNLDWRIARKIGTRDEYSAKQQSRVDKRQLAIPDTFASLHVKEVIIETHIAGCVWRLALRAIQEKKKSAKNSLSGVVTRHPAAFYSYWIRAQRESDHCDAAGRTGHRPIGDQSVGRIALS